MVILDASAVLAWLQREPGGELVRPCLHDGLIPAINWSEVLQKSRRRGVDPRVAGSLLSGLGLQVVDVTEDDGRVAAELWSIDTGHSLAGRICMASALRHDLPVVTADRTWTSVARGPELIVIR